MEHLERPHAGEYAAFYAGYIALVPGGSVLRILLEQKRAYRQLLETVPEERRFESYAPGKWNIAQVCNHINDSERIFCYRALVLSRGEQDPVPGYDHNAYVDAVGVENRTLGGLLDEFDTIRDATCSLFRGLPDACGQRGGIVNNGPMSVRALAYIMAGHLIHHMNILKSRYPAIQTG